MRYARGRQRFLVVVDPNHALFYRVFLDWLGSRFPEIRARFELRRLPTVVHDWDRFALHIPWLQDPVQRWSLSQYRWANQLAEQCDFRGVPVINRVDTLTNAGKSTAARLIASAGIRTPKMALIENPVEFGETLLDIPLPLVVREDWGHGGRIVRADTEAEARAIQMSAFQRPVAVEIIDVQSADTLFRKYRSVVCGDVCIPQSLHVSKQWTVRGARSRTVFSDALVEEEVGFAETPDPHRERFLAAARALCFDVVAFDYSFDHGGDLVVWEANPYPALHRSEGRRAYRNKSTGRVFAAMAKLYLETAGLTLPERLSDELD